jgi:3D (Asp-Asp-Asp) domain-containing protein
LRKTDQRNNRWINHLYSGPFIGMDFKIKAIMFVIGALIILMIHAPTLGIDPEIPCPAPSAPSRDSQTIREIEAIATAYCYSGYKTSTGVWPEEGRTIAVDPDIIPLGSEIQITCETRPEINGVYIAEDTGGKIKGNIIDIYMDKYSDCIKFGKRSVIIKIQPQSPLYN